MNKWKGRYIKVIKGPHKGKVLHIVKYVSKQSKGVRLLIEAYKDGIELKTESNWYIDSNSHHMWKYINKDEVMVEIL